MVVALVGDWTNGEALSWKGRRIPRAVRDMVVSSLEWLQIPLTREGELDIECYILVGETPSTTLKGPSEHTAFSKLSGWSRSNRNGNVIMARKVIRTDRVRTC